MAFLPRFFLHFIALIEANIVVIVLSKPLKNWLNIIIIWERCITWELPVMCYFLNPKLSADSNDWIPLAQEARKRFNTKTVCHLCCTEVPGRWSYGWFESDGHQQSNGIRRWVWRGNDNVRGGESLLVIVQCYQEFQDTRWLHYIRTIS